MGNLTHNCRSCESDLPYSSFPLRVDGYPARRKCKRCCSAEQVERNRAAGWKSQRSPEAEARRKERDAARLAKWTEDNPQRTRIARREGARRFYEKNPAHVHAKNAERRAFVRKAAFAGYDNWVKAIYETAHDLGLQVDHVYPLKGRNGCGLHVPWNMQMLSKSRNSAKRNSV